MSKISNFVIIIFVLFFHCHAQSNKDKIPSFSLAEDGIKHLFFINKNVVSSKDTLDLELEIFNESDKSIFVVPTFHFTYMMDTSSQRPNSIYLDFGGSIENSISGIPFIEIEKNKKYAIEKNFICSNFSYDGFTEEVYFLLWLGYLKPEKYPEFKAPVLSNEYLYFDQSNIKFLEKDLTSMVKIIHKN